MGRYILKRLLSMIVIMFCAAILVFTLMYFVPGDPARLQLGVDIPENILQAKRHELGIDRPYIVQLGSFLYQAFLKLDFGYSWKYGVSVMDELITRLPRTLAIGIPAMLLNLEFLNEHPVYFFGNGAAKCRGQITHPNAHFIDDIRPLGKWMFPLAEKEMVRQNFKDVAYFEPFYLKEFVASKPKKLL